MSNHYNELHSPLSPLPALCLPLPFSFHAPLSSLRPFLSTKTAFFVLRTLKKYPLSTKLRVFVLNPLKRYPLRTK